MRTLRWKLLPVVLLGLLYLPFGWSSVRAGAGQGRRGAAEGPKTEQETEVPRVLLSELRAHPETWLGKPVRFVLQFQGLVDSWNPGLGRFGPADWVHLAGWSDDRYPWDPEVWEHPARHLFSRRGSPVALLMAEARRLERFEVTGVVREVFFDEPWIECTGIEPLYEMISEGTLLHVDRAIEFARQEKWELARQQYERALAAPLPEGARAELEHRMATCRKLRDGAEARSRARGSARRPAARGTGSLRPPPISPVGGVPGTRVGPGPGAASPPAPDRPEAAERGLEDSAEESGNGRPLTKYQSMRH